MDQQAWLEWRRSGIGSSDAPIIMGVSPWRTPLELWEEKVFGYKEMKENPAMTRGKELEEVARRDFELLMDISLFPSNIVHEEHEWIRASLDGIDIDGKVMVEIKWPNREDHELAKNGNVPEKYTPQVQHQLFVKNLDGMFYYSCHGSDRQVVEVERNEDYIKEMMERHISFWDRVVKKTPPELTDRDHICFEGDARWIQLASEWKESKHELEKLTSLVEEFRKEMIEYSQSRNAKGCGVKMSKSICPGAVDHKRALDDYEEKIKALYPNIDLPPLDLELYRKEPFTRWSIRKD